MLEVIDGLCQAIKLTGILFYVLLLLLAGTTPTIQVTQRTGLTMHMVRIKIDGDNDANEYHTAQRLATKISKENPGLTVEVVEDKVWSTVRHNEEGHRG